MQRKGHNCSGSTANLHTHGGICLDTSVSSSPRIHHCRMPMLACMRTVATGACRRRALEEELQKEGLQEEEKKRILGEMELLESKYTRMRRARMTNDSFEPLTIIGAPECQLSQCI